MSCQFHLLSIAQLHNIAIVLLGAESLRKKKKKKKKSDYAPTRHSNPNTNLLIMQLPVTPISKYVIVISDWNCLKYCTFCVFFCTVIVRYIQTFWSTCTISPNDLHPFAAPHFKIFKVFLIYFPKSPNFSAIQTHAPNVRVKNLLLVECCSCNGILHFISGVHLTSSIRLPEQFKYSALLTFCWRCILA